MVAVTQAMPETAPMMEAMTAPASESPAAPQRRAPSTASRAGLFAEARPVSAPARVSRRPNRRAPACSAR